MQLIDILDEISVGYLQNDTKSIKLKNYVNEVKSALEKPNSIIEQRTLNFSFLEKGESSSFDQSQIFFQGSYAIHTAIKHPKYEVDADIAFYINDIVDSSIRLRILESLITTLNSKYSIEIRKPCITIDFNDGYKVDIAIYSKSVSKDTMMFHNSISGSEQADYSKPKAVVSTFNDYLKVNDVKRPVIRLMKHFLKNSTDKLNIPENNKLPTISLMLLAVEEFNPVNSTLNEDTLYNELNSLINICYTTFNIKGLKSLDCPPLLIKNTLYKIDNFNDIDIVINEIKLQLASKNYASMVSKNVYEAISKRSQKETKPSILGTMGQ